MTGNSQGKAAQAERFVATLTPREREVVDQIAEGCTNSEIAERLSMSIRTVENCISVIYEKISEPADAGVRRVQVVLLVLLAASLEKKGVSSAHLPSTSGSCLWAAERPLQSGIFDPADGSKECHKANSKAHVYIAAQRWAIPRVPRKRASKGSALDPGSDHAS